MALSYLPATRAPGTQPATAPASATGLAGSLRVAWLAGLALALFATLHVWADPTGLLIGYPSDPGQYVWFLAWWPHALLHGLNPFETHLANVPFGANLAWNTSLPLAALLLTPVTLLAGPVLSYNLLVVVCLAGNVVSAFMLVRRFLKSQYRALLLAVLFGASPLVAAHAVEHANLMFVGYPLVVLALLHDLHSRRRSARAVGVWLGIATAAEMLYGEEVVAITAVGLLLALGWTATFERRWLRAHAGRLAAALGLGAAVSLPPVFPLLFWQFFGPQRIRPPLYPSSTFSLDLTNLVLGTREQLVHTGLAAKVGIWSGGDVEATGLLLPLALALWLTRRRWWRDRLGRPAFFVALFAAVLAMGPHPHVAGHTLPVPLPGWLMNQVPVFKQILATRLTMLSWCAGLVVLASALGAGAAAGPRLRSRRATFGSGLLVCLGLLVFLPNWPMPGYFADLPSGLSSASRVVHSGDVVEFAPTVGPGAAGSPMLWQALAGYRWSMASAYLVSPQEERRVHGLHSAFPCLDSFVGLTDSFKVGLTADLISCPPDLRQQLARSGVTVLVAGPSPLQGQFGYKIAKVLGPPVREGDLLTWRVGSER